MPLKGDAKKALSKGRRRTNLLKVCSAMNKLAIDAVDKEVVKRFKTVIDSIDDDITKSLASLIINHYNELELKAVPEIFHPYVKHYLFMKKRNDKKNAGAKVK